MCGIVGYIGENDAVPILLDSLKRLEYRGYDSAGIGVIQNGKLEVRRSEGKIFNLVQVLLRDPIRGNVGVAHTRWATHGKPAAHNAHPHRDCTESLAVVHNGIIENCFSLKKELQARGHRFRSETDTEVIVHLLEEELKENLETATGRTLRALKGTYALGIISQNHPQQLLAARNGGPPLVVGFAKDGLLMASDVAAMLDYTRDVLVLDDREFAVLSAQGVRIMTFDGRTVHKKKTRVSWDAGTAEKNGFPHFMLKEIYEQPRTIEDTFLSAVKADTGEVCFPEAAPALNDLERVARLIIVACGTSWHAALVGKYMVEALCRIPVEADIASEFRYRKPIVDPTTLVLAISQSGETADTLGALREAKSKGAKTLAMCNVVGSTMSREADGVIYTRAGLEIGVAATKTFTSQLVILYLFAIFLSRTRGTVSAQQAATILKELRDVPYLAEKVLMRNAQLVELARKLCDRSNFLYLGRGINYPLALEGALKLKEISYIHAEGYPAAEMKHGPIALIDRKMPTVVIAPQDALYDKMIGNIEEIKARNGMVVALASEGDEEIETKADDVFYLPKTSELVLPILLALPLQLLAHHIAVLRNCNVDQPRNLAKSVTVE